MLGYYLIKFSAAIHNAESITEAVTGFETVLHHLKSYFRFFGIIIISVYIIAIFTLLIRIA